MRILIILVATLTLLLGLLMAFGGPISQTGLFDWRMAFTIMQKGAMPLMIGGGLSLLGLIIGVVGKHRGTVAPTLLAVLTAAGVMFTLGNMRSAGGENPIHDVTTDFIDPPAIVAGANLERLNPPGYDSINEYGETGKTVTQWQNELYPDIAPQTFTKERGAVFDTALDVVSSMGITILASDKLVGTIEAVHTSLWFGFSDDFIIRIRADSSGTRVDVRSKSRVGRSDLGANVKRVRTFQAKLQEALG